MSFCSPIFPSGWPWRTNQTGALRGISGPRAVSVLSKKFQTSMLHTKFQCLASLVFVAACTSNVHAVIIVNGDFEQPISTNWFLNIPAGSNVLTGWTVGGTSVDIHSTAHLPGDSRYAYTGNQSVDLLGSPGPGSIAQDLSTIAGGTYVLNFAVSTNPTDLRQGIVNGLLVYWDNVLLDTITTPTPGLWQLYSYTVTALSNFTPLRFASPGVGDEGPLLDAVSVETLNTHAVPEPSSVAIGLAMSISGLILRRSRRGEKRVSWGQARRGHIAPPNQGGNRRRNVQKACSE